MSQNKIMLCCETCVDNYPEGCGHFAVGDLRVTPDGRWLCHSCWDDDENTTGLLWVDAKRPNATGIVAAARAVKL